MNDLATTKQNNAATPVQFNFFDPEQFATMQRVAKMFAHSELVPDIYKIQVPHRIEKRRVPLDGHAEPCHHLWSPVMVGKVLDFDREHLRTI